MTTDRQLARSAIAIAIGVLLASLAPWQPAGAAEPAPIARDDFFESGGGVVYSIGGWNPGAQTLFGNDTPATPGSRLQAELLQGPSHGTLQDFSPYFGGFTYVSEYGFVGFDSFTYRAIDVNGSVSEPARATISVGYPGQTDPRTATQVQIGGPRGLALQGVSPPGLGLQISARVVDASNPSGYRLDLPVTFHTGGPNGPVLCYARPIRTGTGGIVPPVPTPWATCVVPLATGLPLMLDGTPITVVYRPGIEDAPYQPSMATGRFGLL